MDEQYFFLDEKITSHTNTEQPINTMSDLNTHETKDLITTVLQNKDFLIVFCSTLVWGVMMMMLMFKTNTIDELTSEVKEYGEIVNHITTEADDLKDELESLSKYRQQLEFEVSKLQKQVKTGGKLGLAKFHRQSQFRCAFKNRVWQNSQFRCDFKNKKN